MPNGRHAYFSLLFVSLFVITTAANAAPVHFTLTATVSQDGGGLLPGITEGNLVTGTFGVDPSIVPFQQDDTHALYADAFTGLSLVFGSQVITLDAVEPSIIGVTNGNQDFLTLNQVVSSVLLDDFRATALSFRFADFDGLAFDSTAIPTMFEIDAFEFRFVSVEFFSPVNGPIAIVLEVNTIQPVPIPAAAWLLAGGIAFLITLTRRS